MTQERIEVPIAGKIISVYVNVGDEVSEGDTLCLLESMKMENPILAPISGTVIRIHVSPGQIVQAGDLVAIVAPLE